MAFKFNWDLEADIDEQLHGSVDPTKAGSTGSQTTSSSSSSASQTMRPTIAASTSSSPGFNADQESASLSTSDVNSDVTPPATPSTRRRTLEHARDGNQSVSNGHGDRASSSRDARRRDTGGSGLAGLERDVADLSVATASSSDSQFLEIAYEELLHNLPPTVSYSPIDIPLTSRGQSAGATATVLRRDLFDARFQLANEEDDSDDEGSAFGNMIPRNQSPTRGLGFSKSNTDLISGVYEGGLKTWEASLDLVDCLYEQGYRPGEKDIQGARVLEIGCGSALPTMFLLESLFHKLLEAGHSSPETAPRKTVVHLQDYNAEVLLYITFCNILLAFWKARTMTASTAASDETFSESSLPVSRVVTRAEPAHQLGAPTAALPEDDAVVSNGVSYTLDENGDDGAPSDNAEATLNELPITPELVDSFTAFLARHDIELRFFAGPWQRFPAMSQPYDVILTSETVYDVQNLPALCKVMKDAALHTLPHRANGDLASGSGSTEHHDPLTLVACKKVYFGVGGGEYAFREEIANQARVETVWSSRRGVDRTVMSVRWNVESAR